jgi:hypothetical protein
LLKTVYIHGPCVSANEREKCVPFVSTNTLTLVRGGRFTPFLRSTSDSASVFQSAYCPVFACWSTSVTLIALAPVSTTFSVLVLRYCPDSAFRLLHSWPKHSIRLPPVQPLRTLSTSCILLFVLSTYVELVETLNLRLRAEISITRLDGSLHGSPSKCKLQFPLR